MGGVLNPARPAVKQFGYNSKLQHDGIRNYLMKDFGERQRITWVSTASKVQQNSVPRPVVREQTRLRPEARMNGAAQPLSCHPIPLHCAPCR
eukprot:1195871-Prorocentrum_minimum.AAC.10